MLDQAWQRAMHATCNEVMHASCNETVPVLSRICLTIDGATS